MSEGADMELDDAALLRMELAADWLQRLQEGGMSEEDTLDWVRWCEADPANLAAFERIRTVWRQYGELKPAEAPAPLPQSESPRRTAGGWQPRRRLLPVGLAAALAFAVAGAGYLNWHGATPRQIAAAQGNQSTELPDGSSLELGARTTVAVDFAGPQRDLTMSDGRAYFKVHHDKVHPFVVHAGSFTITAVGTAFDVKRDDNGVMVTVEEGKVRISRAATGDVPAATWTAGAGYQLAYSETVHTATVAAVDARQALAWREGRLVYESEPLGSVVDDVNRYAQHHILIRDSRIAAIRFNGTVFTGSVDDWLASVTTAFHLRATRLPDGEVLLESA